jgi:hypothetical protein
VGSVRYNHAELVPLRHQLSWHHGRCAQDKSLWLNEAKVRVLTKPQCG